MSKIRLMIVDDHTVLRAGLRALFDRQTDMQVVAERETAAGTFAIVEAQRPDVLVLDMTLPGGGSIDLIRALRAHAWAPNVLVLTMHDDPAYARSALSAGASGYVVKTIGENELLEAIRAVYRGRLFIDLDDPGKTAALYGPSKGVESANRVDLSDRELEVLEFLGRGFTNQQIAETLDVSPKTIATYRARIAAKLGLRTTAEFVKYAADTGLLGRDPA